MIRATQDDARERRQIELFDLIPLQGRSNKYIPDAKILIDGEEHRIELKTSDVIRKQVSTARNITISKLDEYKNVHWVFSQYRKTKNGFEFTGEHYYAHGRQLKPWLDKQQKTIMEGTKTYGGLELWGEAKRHLQKLLDESKITKLDNVFTKRGGLNDPKISWNEIKNMCVKIDMNNPAKHLRELCKGATNIK